MVWASSVGKYGNGKGVASRFLMHRWRCGYMRIFSKARTPLRLPQSRPRWKADAKGETAFRCQSGANSYFVHRGRCAKCLRCLDGDVAEWLKAAVC